MNNSYDKNQYIGSYCIAKTYRSRVFAGTVVDLESKGAILKNARRIWSWSGAASLSELAINGTGDPQGCKLPGEVDFIYLTEIIEMIQCTEKAKRSIENIPVWKRYR